MTSLIWIVKHSTRRWSVTNLMGPLRISLGASLNLAAPQLIHQSIRWVYLWMVGVFWYAHDAILHCKGCTSQELPNMTTTSFFTFSSLRCKWWFEMIKMISLISDAPILTENVQTKKRVKRTNPCDTLDQVFRNIMLSSDKFVQKRTLWAVFYPFFIPKKPSILHWQLLKSWDIKEDF